MQLFEEELCSFPLEAGDDTFREYHKCLALYLQSTEHPCGLGFKY